MKKCELCESTASMYCESDQASLCWDCDVKVHGANFLVARHSRTLLCHSCQNPTPWSATGTELGPTVSVCHNCSAVALPSHGRETREIDVLDLDNDSVDHDDADSEDEEEDERENQVVPGCLPPSSPPTVMISSITEEELCDDAANAEDVANSISLNRNHECSSDLGFPEKFRRLNNPRERSLVSNATEDDDNLERPLKERRIEPFLDRMIQGRTGLVKESIASGNGTSTSIVGLRRLSRNSQVI